MKKIIIDGVERTIETQGIDRYGFLVFNVIGTCGCAVAQHAVPADWFNSNCQTCVKGGYTYTRVK